MKKYIILMHLLMIISACTNEVVPVKVESVILDSEELTITEGERKVLTATVLPENAENQTVHWSSNKNEVATVEDGVVTAVSPGTAIITAISDEGGRKALCVVTVIEKPIPVNGVSLDRENARVFLNGYLTLAATIQPLDATNRNLVWKSDDESIAAVSDGVVTGIGLGRTSIWVETEDGGFKAECVIDVVEERQTQSKGPMTLDLGEVTATTAVLSGVLDINQTSDYDMAGGGVGFIYAPTGVELNVDIAEKVQISSVDYANGFSKTLTGLWCDTEYHYTIYLYKNSICQYGKTQTFRTKDVVITVDDVIVTHTTATLSGKVEREDCDEMVKVGIQYSKDENFSGSSTKSFEIVPENGAYSRTIEKLDFNTTYYYRTYTKQNSVYKYGESVTFTTNSIGVELSASSKTRTSMTITGKIDPVAALEEVTVAVIANNSETVSKNDYTNIHVLKSSDIDDNGAFSITWYVLPGETYHYTYYILSNNVYSYGEVQTFATEALNVTVEVDNITYTTAEFMGTVDFQESDVVEVGILYTSSSNKFDISTDGVNKIVLNGKYDAEGNYMIGLDNLSQATTYHYCYYFSCEKAIAYGALSSFETQSLYDVQTVLDMSDATDLSLSASANCYIVSSSGLYKFKTVKGNSSDSVGGVTTASILWETFGTSTAPELFDLICELCYKDGYIAFKTADAFKEGNAVIAAKDSERNVLWSWHIWLTDQPQAHVYKNDAGTMMDRNLGATSATKRDVGALGLLYQWGRKDPFLGSSSISSSTLAKSTITWPSAVESNSSNGTIEYATAHPTTFITHNRSNYDWYYTGDSSTDNTRWTESESSKSIYDPCPSGWRVPDAGIWSKAGFYDTTYDGTNEGISFSISSPSKTWYPASGGRSNGDGGLINVGNGGGYWSASPRGERAYFLDIDDYGYVETDYNFRALGFSVRCIKD